MNRLVNICSGLILAGILCLLGCAVSGPGTADAPSSTEGSHRDARGFDPLELPQDREIVPLEHKRTGDISGKKAIVEPGDESSLDSLGAGLSGPEMPIDTLNNQVYRVQLFTSRVYGDGRQAARVAEEIFDQPVYVDYEVPNYKVRVGNFGDRLAAEDYQQRVRAAGYDRAWVVMVNVGVREVAPLYEEDTGLFLPVPSAPVDTLPSKEEAAGGSED